jgi:hypothetical protein
MKPSKVQDFCTVEPAAENLLKAAIQHLHLLARSVHRILKIARTITDLAAARALQPITSRKPSSTGRGKACRSPASDGRGRDALPQKHPFTVVLKTLLRTAYLHGRNPFLRFGHAVQHFDFKMSTNWIKSKAFDVLSNFRGIRCFIQSHEDGMQRKWRESGIGGRQKSTQEI